MVDLLIVSPVLDEVQVGMIGGMLEAYIRPYASFDTSFLAPWKLFDSRSGLTLNANQIYEEFYEEINTPGEHAIFVTNALLRDPDKNPQPGIYDLSSVGGYIRAVVSTWGLQNQSGRRKSLGTSEEELERLAKILGHTIARAMGIGRCKTDVCISRAFYGYGRRRELDHFREDLHQRTGICSSHITELLLQYGKI